MAGYPIPFPKYFATDNNGNPLSGGLLYTYLAGTSTPAATYSDAALTTANANPVVLDAAGRATVFIPDSSVASFLFIQKTAAGATIWSQDNVSIPQIVTPAAAADVPTGSILMFGGATAPAGYLLCDGSAVSRITYDDLFAIAGTAFGPGNGSTTFNVPDLRQRFPLGVSASGTGATRGGTGGTIDHVHTGPSHTHVSPSHAHSITHTHIVPRDGWGGVLNANDVAGRLYSAAGAGVNVDQATLEPPTGASSAANSGSTVATTDAAGTGNTGSANPAFIALNFIIKT